MKLRLLVFALAALLGTTSVAQAQYGRRDGHRRDDRNYYGSWDPAAGTRATIDNIYRAGGWRINRNDRYDYGRGSRFEYRHRQHGGYNVVNDLRESLAAGALGAIVGAEIAGRQAYEAVPSYDENMAWLREQQRIPARMPRVEQPAPAPVVTPTQTTATTRTTVNVTLVPTGTRLWNYTGQTVVVRQKGSETRLANGNYLFIADWATTQFGNLPGCKLKRAVTDGGEKVVCQ